MYRTAIFILGTVAAGAAGAAPVSYTDRSAFDAAIAAIGGLIPVIEDYEGFTGEANPTVGDVIVDGSTANGITYSYLIDGGAYQLGIRGEGGISGTNTLGATDDSGVSVEQLGFDDEITFGFAASNAFGFSVLTSNIDDLWADDFTLSFAGGTLSPDGSDGTAGANGGEYFFGIVDAAQTHTTATLTFNDIGAAIAELDDVTISVPDGTPIVPLPAGLPLLLTAVGGIALLRRR